MITNLKENTIGEIAKFHKANFNVENIVSNASSLKYIKEIKKLIGAELENPTNDFTKLFANKVYAGRLTEKVVDEFKDLVLKSVNQFINDKINDRLNAALTKETIKQQDEEVTTVEDDNKINTTEEELDGYRIVVAILRRKLPTNRIVHRDTQSYFGILLDDNNRKPLCRLHLNGGKKYISLFNDNKSETKLAISTIDDIYRFEKELLETITLYETE